MSFASDSGMTSQDKGSAKGCVGKEKVCVYGGGVKKRTKSCDILYFMNAPKRKNNNKKQEVRDATFPIHHEINTP